MEIVCGYTRKGFPFSEYHCNFYNCKLLSRRNFFSLCALSSCLKGGLKCTQRSIINSLKNTSAYESPINNSQRHESDGKKYIPGICKGLHAGPKMVLISMDYEIEV